MKSISLFALLLVLTGCKKEHSVFEVKTRSVKKNIVDELKRLKFKDAATYYGLLYKDEKYEAWKSCSGEWGGTIYFKNRKSGLIHYAIATCPVSVNKINGKYYISNSLSHLFGHSYILEISNPESMELTEKIPLNLPGIITRPYEAQTRQGTKKVVDSSGVIIAASFVYNQKLYAVLSSNDGKQTTISELKGKKFETILKLPEKLFYSEPLVVKKADNNLSLYFQNPKSGILHIRDNKIELIYYQNKTGDKKSAD